jgi:hypothetical protein
MPSNALTEDEKSKLLHSHMGEAMADGKLSEQERQSLVGDLQGMFSGLSPAQATEAAKGIQDSLVAGGMSPTEATALISSAMQP